MEILEHLQLAALYHASTTSDNAETVFSIADVSDFEPGHQQDIAEVICELLATRSVEQIAVANKAKERKTSLFTWFFTHVKDEYYSTPTYTARAVKDAANKRRLAATLTRGLSRLETVSADQVLADLTSELEVADAHIDSGLNIVPLSDVLDAPDDLRPWIMPHMLRTNERVILTGPEGGGKSILVAQICLGAAMGINTLDPSLQQHEPMRVLMLDVENDRLQVRNNMRKIYPVLREMRNIDPIIEWVDVADIDLSDPLERQQVIKVSKERQPQLMYMGSLYRLAPEGDKVDSAFVHVSRTVDRIRSETGASVLLEAHAGHGLSNDRNGMRPYGSSMWMRWPEFGLGMVRHTQTNNILLRNWRGHRSDDRSWPVGLRRGSLLPWQGIPADEWEALYGPLD